MYTGVINYMKYISEQCWSPPVKKHRGGLCCSCISEKEIESSHHMEWSYREMAAFLLLKLLLVAVR